MTTYRVTIRERTYEVRIEDLDATPIQITVDGEPFAASIEETRIVATPTAPRHTGEPASMPTRQAPAPRPAPWATNASILIAPMPGTIMDIRVSAGQAVKREQELCILEAMKMKNSIKSPRAGIIAEIKISQGQSVAYGDALFIFE